MKKFLHGLSGLIVILLPFLLGAFLVYINGFNTAMRDQLGDILVKTPIYGSVAGGVLCLIALLYVCTFGKKKKPTEKKPETLSFIAEDGVVTIGVPTVVGFITKVGEEFGTVLDLVPTVSSKKNIVSIILEVKVQAGTRIPELSQMLQNRVRESVRDGLGITDISEIKVHVNEIVGSPINTPSE